MAAIRWTQVEIKVCAGAERWLIVRYAGRCFKLPADAPLEDLLQGVRDGWTMAPRKARRGVTYYRVPASSVAQLDGTTRS